MAREKSVTITEELFIDLCRYFGTLVGEPDHTLEKRIAYLLQQKVDRIIDHDLYTLYKTGATKEQKERARKQYLERRGIPESFWWGEGQDWSIQGGPVYDETKEVN